MTILETLALKVRGLQKNYADFELHNIDLDLPTGQIMGLVGANGAGKSTIMRILIGLIKADQGLIEVRGHRIPDAQVAIKREVGYVSDDMRLYKAQTLRWHMDFIQSVYPDWDEAYAGQLLKRFDLRAHQVLRGFSHGQRVKALLLLILARRPKLLLLDEPTTGLDPVARIEVLEALAEVLRDEERSVLFSSHNTMDVEQLSDTITFLHQGKLVASQDKESFLSSWRRVVCQGRCQGQYQGQRQGQRQGQCDDALLARVRALPEVASARNSGSIIELKVREGGDIFLSRLQQLGLTITTVEPMSLEDIFVTSVRAGGSQ
jgi:ABC-2 type transport system ATP-binding protein